MLHPKVNAGSETLHMLASVLVAFMYTYEQNISHTFRGITSGYLDMTTGYSCEKENFSSSCVQMGSISKLLPKLTILKGAKLTRNKMVAFLNVQSVYHDIYLYKGTFILIQGSPIGKGSCMFTDTIPHVHRNKGGLF